MKQLFAIIILIISIITIIPIMLLWMDMTEKQYSNQYSLLEWLIISARGY